MDTWSASLIEAPILKRVAGLPDAGDLYATLVNAAVDQVDGGADVSHVAIALAITPYALGDLDETLALFKTTLARVRVAQLRLRGT